MSTVEKVEKTLTVQGLLQDLQDGLTRDDIAVKYGITKAEVRVHFQHPKLKNKKTIKAPALKYTLVDEDDLVKEEVEPETETASIEDMETVEDEAEDMETVEDGGETPWATTKA